MRLVGRPSRLCPDCGWTVDNLPTEVQYLHTSGSGSGIFGKRSDSVKSVKERKSIVKTDDSSNENCDYQVLPRRQRAYDARGSDYYGAGAGGAISLTKVSRDLLLSDPDVAAAPAAAFNVALESILGIGGGINAQHAVSAGAYRQKTQGEAQHGRRQLQRAVSASESLESDPMLRRGRQPGLVRSLTADEQLAAIMREKLVKNNIITATGIPITTNKSSSRNRLVEGNLGTRAHSEKRQMLKRSTATVRDDYSYAASRAPYRSPSSKHISHNSSHQHKENCAESDAKLHISSSSNETAKRNLKTRNRKSKLSKDDPLQRRLHASIGPARKSGTIASGTTLVSGFVKPETSLSDAEKRLSLQR